MSVAVFTPETSTYECPVVITEKALTFFKNKLKKQDIKAIRVWVKKSGCAGFSYMVDYGEKAKDTDTKYDVNGVGVYLCEEAKTLIKGSEIDLKVEGLNKNIIFHNPNATASCGCGTSFSVD